MTAANAAPDDTPRGSRPRSRLTLAVVVVLLLGAGVAVSVIWLRDSVLSDSESTIAATPAHDAEASKEEVVQFCGACHAYPPPETLPRIAWDYEVKRGYTFFQDTPLPLTPPPVAAVVRYYERRAPALWPLLEPQLPPGSPPFRFERVGFQDAGRKQVHAVTHVAAARLLNLQRPEIIACDAALGKVFMLRPYEPAPRLETLAAKLAAPAHSTVVDLDGDGQKDLLVACLGVFESKDARQGSIVWLRRSANGTFTPVVLADQLGRVAAVEAADFDGDGDLDLVVAEFGSIKVGQILYLDNRTTDYARPQFVPRTLDPRHGGIHVPVADLNGDGRPDFVALISQEHETVVAFLNQGAAQFRSETIYTGPHPTFGSTGIQLVDFDQDGDLDVLFTNGDSIDSVLLRPYHGIQWLENRGGYPFVSHPLVFSYGINRAVAWGRTSFASIRWSGSRAIIRPVTLATLMAMAGSISSWATSSHRSPSAPNRSRRRPLAMAS
jgi:hypothetical protein